MEDGNSISVHKAVLCARSPFFRNKIQIGADIVLPGAFDAGVELLRFLYTARLPGQTEAETEETKETEETASTYWKWDSSLIQSMAVDMHLLASHCDVPELVIDAALFRYR